MQPPPDAAPAAIPSWQVHGMLAESLTPSDLGMQQRAMAWLPGGKFKTRYANFSGGTSVGFTGFSLYGVDGVNPAWVYDGESVRFVETGMALAGFDDNPNSLAVLPTQQLVLGYYSGTLMISSVGQPAEFTVSTGAAEIAVSDYVIDMATQPNDRMAIFCRSSLRILTGKSAADWTLSTFSEKLSMTPWSLQTMGDAVFMTDDGVTRLNRVQEFGDFRDMSLTQKVKPLIDKLKRKVLCSWNVMSRNEYRLVFESGLGIIIKFNGMEVAGISTFDYGVRINVAHVVEGGDRVEHIYAGDAENGRVYRLEHGDSFDGQSIEAVASTMYNFVGSVEYRKRFKKVQLEVDTPEFTRLKVRAQLDYSSPEAPVPFLHDVAVTGGGGFYDMSYFQDILWSDAETDLTDHYIQGVGRNIAVSVYSNSKHEPPHRLSAMVLHWSPRARRR